MPHDWIDHVLQVLQIGLMLATYLHHRSKVKDRNDPEHEKDFEGPT